MEELNKPKLAEYQEIATEITAMYEADQAMRKRWEEYRKLPERPEETEEDRTLDQKNTARMKEIVERIGWPTISKMGEDASSHAWCLIQHADKDVEFQEHCLNLMKGEPIGEVDLHDIAYLEDRIRVNRKRPQLYGTQFDWTEDDKPIQDIEDREHVGEKRKKMGLNTLAENIEEMYEAYGIPKPD